MIAKKYGYGIVDKDGCPWWFEDCVCADRAQMDETVHDLNQRDIPNLNTIRQPFRVVRLVYLVAK